MFRVGRDKEININEWRKNKEKICNKTKENSEKIAHRVGNVGE